GPLHRALPPQIAFQLALAEWGARIQLRAQTRLLTESIHDLQQAGHPAPDVQATVQNLSALNYLSRLEARFHRLQSRALNDLRRLRRRPPRPKNQKMTKPTQHPSGRAHHVAIT